MGVAMIRSFLTAHKRETLFSAIFFFAASLSFGLGYSADQAMNGRPIVIERCPTNAPAAVDDQNGPLRSGPF